MLFRFWLAKAAALIASLQAVSASALPSSQRSQSFLATSALQEILFRGKPLLGMRHGFATRPRSWANYFSLGTDEGCSRSKTCDWMAKIPDSTKLVHMNLPGVHDAATGAFVLTHFVPEFSS
jgi:1-phosphatidylinositol phosphodiesterase